jgi:putative ABC transport system permease protein
MKFYDYTQLAFTSLWQSKLRTILTILGVVIGVAALTSMISFGTGMQKNITDSFKENELFTSLQITPRKISIEDLASGSPDSIAAQFQEEPVELNDSIVDLVNEFPEVISAFPDISIPVRIRYKGNETKTNVRALPVSMGTMNPYNNLFAGNFFEHNSGQNVIVRRDQFSKMGILLKDKDDPSDTSAKKAPLPVEDVLHDSIEIVSVTFDRSKMLFNPLISAMGGKPPVKDTVLTFKIAGISNMPAEFTADRMGGGVFVPLETAKAIPNLGFTNVWDILGKLDDGLSHYGSIYVRVKDVTDVTPVVNKLKEMNLNTFAFSEELKDIKRAFLIMDSLLGAIGLIALVVAALGIINTMVMSILERRKEIGIMKSIGASEREIKAVFFVEASTIGFIGAIFGLGLGWVVTRLANQIMNAKIVPEDMPPVDMFYFPWWLVSGAIVFSILLSLAAGLYPAMKAANTDPIKALRHE